MAGRWYSQGGSKNKLNPLCDVTLKNSDVILLKLLVSNVSFFLQCVYTVEGRKRKPINWDNGKQSQCTTVLNAARHIFSTVLL